MRSVGCWPVTMRSTPLDVSQTLGRLPIDVDAIGCQVAFGPGRKFLRAPRGTGALYVDATLADRLVPLTPELGSVGPAGDLPFDLAAGARRFDTFEADIAGRLGLGVSARTADAVGLETIARLVRDRSADVTALLERGRRRPPAGSGRSRDRVVPPRSPRARRGPRPHRSRGRERVGQPGRRLTRRRRSATRAALGPGVAPLPHRRRRSRTARSSPDPSGLTDYSIGVPVGIDGGERETCRAGRVRPGTCPRSRGPLSPGDRARRPGRPRWPRSAGRRRRGPGSRRSPGRAPGRPRR